MTSLIRALSSSIGKKLLMGITGLALCGFLVVHLSGNMLLYVGAEQYDAYAHALHSQKFLLPIAETGLFILLIMHIALGIITARENWAARAVPYDMQRSKVVETTSKGAPNFASKYMFLTGLVVLMFLLVHIGHFKLGVISPGPEGATEFANAARILSQSFTHVVYLAGTLVLGFHLLHGFQSAFQSLGINHPKYTKPIKIFGILFAMTIGLGFASFPLMGILGYFSEKTPPPAVEASETTTPEAATDPK
ncbi:Succinate dehydrogenase/Fumarate reductase transmembrane subunit [Symmachiella macrocystis]|uniref:Succinate dehydrogenase/Fumarate reductase transmembrane subunit n=1 Tax=Symmachiella macrocystis TaxID=2527985 RepID=A0A5C6BAC4_9PLAN|nr:succinate dehydrogenase cytochrome b subunit [Symmachiella macrocystis]TWU09225.1 Succinate dehydrogenase/Fumarate reductase transmembrane subunit [Symmachiella macrocystis]